MQYAVILKIWDGILNNRLIVTFVINGSLTAAIYEDMLRNQIIPLIRKIAGENFEHI